MSVFTERAAVLYDMLQAEKATSGWSYTSPTGSTTSSLTLMLETDPAATLMSEQETELEVYGGRIVIAQSVLTTPAKHGYFTDTGGTKWAVLEEPNLTEGLWTCRVQRMVRDALGHATRVR